MEGKLCLTTEMKFSAHEFLNVCSQLYRPLSSMAFMHVLKRSILRSFSTRAPVFAMPPKPIVLCGPSGSGKSTLLKKLLAEFDSCFGFSVSHTTRQPREGEEDGVHYHFVTREVMAEAVENGEFLEHAQFAGNWYGTNRSAVEDVINSNRICILDIEVEGVKQVKETDLHPHFIFVKPPSLESLEERLRARGTETEESLSNRLAVAGREMEFGEAEGNFDLIVVNDDVDEAYEELRKHLLSDIEDVTSANEES